MDIQSYHILSIAKDVRKALKACYNDKSFRKFSNKPRKRLFMQLKNKTIINLL